MRPELLGDEWVNNNTVRVTPASSTPGGSAKHAYVDESAGGQDLRALEPDTLHAGIDRAAHDEAEREAYLDDPAEHIADEDSGREAE